MAEITCGITLCVVGNRLSVIGGKLVLPRAVPVGVALAVLGKYIAVAVVGHGVDGTAVHLLGQELTQSIVGIYSGSVNGIYYLGYSVLSFFVTEALKSSPQYSRSPSCLDPAWVKLCQLFIYCFFIGK